MKILLIRPKPAKETIGLQHVMLVEPLELETIAATVPRDNCIIIDMIIETKPIEYFIKKERPDIIGVTGYITDVPEMIRICRIAKDIDIKIITIAGGIHVEVIPEDLENASIDYRVVRNATIEFPKLIEYVKDNKKKFPKGILKIDQKINLNDLPSFEFYSPIPRRELCRRYRKKYFYGFHDKVALIKTSFGCPYRCSFCFCRKITRDNYYTRPILDVLNELKDIKEKEIYIVDDDFLVSKDRINSFLNGLEKLRIKKHYLIYARSDFIVNNKELVYRFKKNGLRTIIIGFESFNENELEQYNKKNSVKTNEEAMKILNRLRIDVCATVIIPPHWDHADFLRLQNKLLSLKIRIINLQPLTPLPGTDYKYSKDKIIIDRKDFLKWDLAHVSILPEKMSVSEFYKNIIKVYEKILYNPNDIPYYLTHNPKMFFKMLIGSSKVHKQYIKKYKESLKNA